MGSSRQRQTFLGVIVEGSLASATSKQTEIHLTNVARASLGELLEDYKDLLRLRGLPIWPKEAPRMLALRALGRDDATTHGPAGPARRQTILGLLRLPGLQRHTHGGGKISMSTIGQPKPPRRLSCMLTSHLQASDWFTRRTPTPVASKTTRRGCRVAHAGARVLPGLGSQH